ncbi:MAG TPA: DNA-binding protein [Thermomicrobiales bacterium]|nr:DNA-binding protein [Thermomicrobiales bacterium]
MVTLVAIESIDAPVASFLPPTEQAAIDQALELVYAENRRLTDLLGLVPAVAPNLVELRRSPLGVDLQRLASYGLGTTDEKPEDVLAAVESTLQVLFWPTAATDYAVPAPFWRTLLGRMLGRAKRRALAAEGLIGVAEAARLLGVDEATVERWTADRLLESVPNASAGRPLVGRRSVERLLALAAELPQPGQRQGRAARKDGRRPYPSDSRSPAAISAS